MFQVQTALQERRSFRLALKWKWMNVTSVTVTMGTGGSLLSVQTLMPRQADCVEAIPTRRRALRRRGHGFHTAHLQNKTEQTNSCQLQQGHQQNLLGLTKVNILLRGHSLFLSGYKIYIVYSYWNRFCNYPCLMVTWPLDFWSKKKEIALNRLLLWWHSWPASSPSTDLLHFYSSVNMAFFSCSTSFFAL